NARTLRALPGEDLDEQRAAVLLPSPVVLWRLARDQFEGAKRGPVAFGKLRELGLLARDDAIQADDAHGRGHGASSHLAYLLNEIRGPVNCMPASYSSTGLRPSVAGSAR